MIKVTCPLYVTLSRVKSKDKKISINLNTYRNLYHYTNNEVKKKYLEIVRKQLEGVIIDTPVEVTYTVSKAQRRKLDKLDVISIKSKYLMNSITQLECWEDDNDDFIQTETIMTTVIDREKPRVEVFIKSI